MSVQVESVESPARLRDGNDEVALLLRGESTRRLEPGRPFFAVVQKRTARQIRNVSIAAVGVMCAFALSFWGRAEPGAMVIAAEPAQLEASSEQAGQLVPSSSPAVLAKEVLAEKSLVLGGARNPESIPEQEQPIGPTAVKAVRPGLVEKSENSLAGADCGVLSRAGDYSKALECFRSKSQGRGTSAEIGFLEMARIQRRALGDLAGALTTLESYQRRFPSGTLSPEAERLKQELLRGQNKSDARLERNAE